ncbi:MAG: ANTAR domain-containing protein, partial [Actinomycetota bacterium]
MPDGAVVRRTADGWSVGDEDMPDLTSAMVLADLIAAELADGDAVGTEGTTLTASHAAAPAPGRGRPVAKAKAGADDAGSDDETSRLRATIGQLERALSVRVRVEQAIGILAERHRVRPRQAFEQLRSVARGSGQRVIDIAGDVIASATNPLLQLPDELSRPSSVARQR